MRSPPAGFTRNAALAPLEPLLNIFMSSLPDYFSTRMKDHEIIGVSDEGELKPSLFPPDDFTSVASNEDFLYPTTLKHLLWSMKCNVGGRKGDWVWERGQNQDYFLPRSYLPSHSGRSGFSFSSHD